MSANPASSSSFLTGGTGGGAAQRRFNKLFRERRKSLGAMLDVIPSWEYDRIVRGEAAVEDGGVGYRRDDVCEGGKEALSATGHSEIDRCLGHHLRRAEGSLQVWAWGRLEQCRSRDLLHSHTALL